MCNLQDIKTRIKDAKSKSSGLGQQVGIPSHGAHTQSNEAQP